jgi:protein TonB
LNLARDTACRKTLEPRISDAIAFADWIDPEADSHRPSAASMVPQVAQTDTAKPNVPAPSTKKSAPAPGAAAVAKWHKALAARLARYNRYPAQGNSAEGLVSVAFTIDRKGKVLSSRIEKTSGSTVLDAEALAWLRPRRSVSGAAARGHRRRADIRSPRPLHCRRKALASHTVK